MDLGRATVKIHILSQIRSRTLYVDKQTFVLNETIFIDERSPK